MWLGHLAATRCSETRNWGFNAQVHRRRGRPAAESAAVAGTAMAGKDLDAIKARGSLNCGVGIGTAGFMLADSQGKWRGLSVDVCRAVAAALFGDAEKGQVRPSPRSSASPPCSRAKSTW